MSWNSKLLLSLSIRYVNVTLSSRKYSISHITKSIIDLIPTLSISPETLNDVNCVDHKTLTYFPVTHVLSKTVSPESMFVLNRWRANKIKALGQEGFDNYMNGMHYCLKQL